MKCPICQTDQAWESSYSSSPVGVRYALKCGHNGQTIYHDPITRTKPEGVAFLLKEYRPDTGDGLSMWEVVFEGETEPVLRTIYQPS